MKNNPSHKSGTVPAQSNSPIFIHSLWRTGSTYLFSVFRRSRSGYWCYQEPLHEIALSCKDNPERLLDYIGDILLPLRHPRLDKSYYFELYEVAPFWKDIISKPIIYDQYFDSSCSENLKDYLQTLITNSRGRTVIQECRTSNRIQALKKEFGGVHLYLWRNPRDQWWSYKATNYFDNTNQLILNAPVHPDVISRLRREINFKAFHDENIYQELNHFDLNRLSPQNSYLVFYLIWCMGLLEGVSHADQLINIDALSDSAHYQNDICKALSSHGVNDIDFSDCSAPQIHFTERETGDLKKLEDRVHGLLLLSGYPQHCIDNLSELQKVNNPKSLSTPLAIIPPKKLVDEAQIARDIVLRHESIFAERSQHAVKQHQEDHLKILSLHNDILRQTEDARARESVLTQQCNKKDGDISSILQTLAEREKEFVQQIMRTRENADIEKTKLLKTFLNNEKNLRGEFSNRDIAIRKELSDTLRKLAARENEFAEQLLNIQKKTYQEKMEMARLLSQKEQAFEQQKADLVHIHSEKMQSLQLGIRHNEDILKAEQHQRICAIQQLNEIRQSTNALEDKYKQQLQSEQQAATNLQLSITALQEEIGIIHSSFSWWITAPLRALSRFLNINSEQYNARSSGNFFSATPPQRMSYSPDPLEITTNRHIFSEVANMSANIIQEPLTAAKTVEELLSFFDKEFVHRSYLTILDREPDAEGMVYYLRRIRSGISKVEILSQLRSSREGKNLKKHIPGLDSTIRKFRFLKTPLIGPIFRSLGVNAGSTIDQRLSAIENQLFVMSEKSGQSIEITDQIAALRESSNNNFLQTMHAISGLQSLLAKLPEKFEVSVLSGESALQKSAVDSVSPQHSSAESTTSLLSRTIVLKSADVNDVMNDLATHINHSREAQQLSR